MILPPDFLTKISRLSLPSSQKGRGQHTGSHRSKYQGASLDFSDFRSYQPGDDIRQIDWNVFARTNKHYIKQYLDEREMKRAIYVDGSLSMSDPEKWLMTQRIAAVLATLTLQQDDRLHLHVDPSKESRPYRGKGRSAVQAALHHLENSHPAGRSSFAQQAPGFFVKGVHQSFLLSDGLEEKEKIAYLLERHAQASYDPWFIQIQTREEQDPVLSGDVRLLDRENEEVVQVAITPVRLEQYRERWDSHQREIKQLCDRYRIRHLLVRSDEELTQLIFKKWRQMGWVV